MTPSTNDLLDRVHKRSSSLRRETLAQMSLSEDDFNNLSSEMNDLSLKILDGHDLSKDFQKMNELQQQIAVMTVCKEFAKQLDKCYTDGNNELPISAHNITNFLNIVPPKMALTALRVEVCVERFITWNLDLLPDFSKIIENIHKSVNNS